MANEVNVGLTPPERPKAVSVTHTIQNRESLSEIAERYHTSVNSIMELNGIKDAGKIRAGAKITVEAIPDKEYKQYVDLKRAYDEKVYAEKVDKAVKERCEKAEAKIQQAVEKGWGEDYNFRVNKQTGEVIITLKKNKKLHEIRSDFKLPGGTISENNDLQAKYGKIPTVNDGTRDIETWNNVQAKAGDELAIPPESMRPGRTWTQFFKDMLPF